MKQIGLTFILSSILIACNTPFTKVDCKCASSAVEVKVVDSSGIILIPDSIKYKFDNDTIVTIKANENDILFSSLGYHPGEYTIWAYYKGNESEPINVSVSMSGPSDCRRPSTKEVRIVFNENEYDTYEIKKIGGCGE